MSQQESFQFAREDRVSTAVEKRLSEKEINRRLREMQAMPDGPAKDAAAQAILDCLLSR